eukprot:TRINITY_DN5888_c1_g1_i1.p2 TRINITY_DN5888_c1_g1~~TRINITY_DN5888_c1_g1_i1.p2  ORF type:complete len:171 (+),score=29.37 TRINITY_DN5888_c1_g1_i1:35-547(+)
MVISRSDGDEGATGVGLQSDESLSVRSTDSDLSSLTSCEPAGPYDFVYTESSDEFQWDVAPSRKKRTRSKRNRTGASEWSPPLSLGASSVKMPLISYCGCDKTRRSRQFFSELGDLKRQKFETSSTMEGDLSRPFYIGGSTLSSQFPRKKRTRTKRGNYRPMPFVVEETS